MRATTLCILFLAPIVSGLGCTNPYTEYNLVEFNYLAEQDNIRGKNNIVHQLGIDTTNPLVLRLSSADVNEKSPELLDHDINISLTKDIRPVSIIGNEINVGAYEPYLQSSLKEVIVVSDASAVRLATLFAIPNFFKQRKGLLVIIVGKVSKDRVTLRRPGDQADLDDLRQWAFNNQVHVAVIDEEILVYDVNTYFTPVITTRIPRHEHIAQLARNMERKNRGQGGFGPNDKIYHALKRISAKITQKRDGLGHNIVPHFIAVGNNSKLLTVFRYAAFYD